MINWKLEDDVNDFVKSKLNELGLKKNIDFNVESVMTDYMKESFNYASKTEHKTGFGRPDFSLEGYKIPVIIENKLGLKNLKSKVINTELKDINKFAVNGVIYYANKMIESGKYNEVIAIGISGDNEENYKINVFYVYGPSIKTIKELDIDNLSFLKDKNTFNEFLLNAKLSENEKQQIFINSKKDLNHHAKQLNKLMHNLNISSPQRVLYVSGMLLAMQDIKEEGQTIDSGLCCKDLSGSQIEGKRDGVMIVNQIEGFLKRKNIKKEKFNLMMSSFKEISKDEERDKKIENDKIVSKILKDKNSINKQVFTYIYENIYKEIDDIAGHIDYLGEMYSEFLKYALGDGKELGIVLTPPYVTKMMVELLSINSENKVMDLATGSAGFLISAMEVMIKDSKSKFSNDEKEQDKKIQEIKENQLLGVELNAEMFTLATTNMILRGDGHSKIKKGSTFDTPKKLYEEFKADRFLLNPPFSYEENGMPFVLFSLNNMIKGGLGAVIIQDSAGTGQATKTNKKILKKHSLIASIKMPGDLFVPSAGVQTSIYIFKAHEPHDYEKVVKFIDFRHDGYKRTKRGINVIDDYENRYEDIIKIYKAGTSALVDKDIWDLNNTYIEDFITNSGNDWDFTQHLKKCTIPTIEDFKKTVSEYLSYEVNKLLKDGDETGK